jgi:hypothetical protein
MPPPLPPEVRNAICEDGRDGRLTRKEIAALRLGDEKKHGTVTRILKQAGIPSSRKRGQSKKFHDKCSIPKPETIADINLEHFGPEERLLLIDQAISELKAILPKSRYPLGLMQWTTALERLLEQRRKETGGSDDDDDERGSIAAAFDELRRLENAPSSGDAKAPPDGV